MFKKSFFVLIISLMIVIIYFSTNSQAYFYEAGIYDPLNNYQYELILEEIINQKIEQNQDLISALAIIENNDYYHKLFEKNLATYIKGRVHFWTYSFEAIQETYKMMLANEFNEEEAYRELLERKIDHLIAETIQILKKKTESYSQERLEKEQTLSESDNIVKLINDKIEEADKLELEGIENLQRELEDLGESEKKDFLQRLLENGEIFFFDYLELIMLNNLDESLAEDNLEKHNQLAYTLPYDFLDYLTEDNQDIAENLHLEDILIEKPYFLELILQELELSLFERNDLMNFDIYLKIVSEKYLGKEDFEHFTNTISNFNTVEIEEKLLEIDRKRSYIFHNAFDYQLFLKDILKSIEKSYLQENPMLLFASLVDLPFNSYRSVQDYLLSIKDISSAEIKWLRNKTGEYIKELNQYLTQIDNQDIENNDSQIVNKVLTFMSFFEEEIKEKLPDEYEKLIKIFEELQEKGILYNEGR
jgi:hypothetical protein